MRILPALRSFGFQSGSTTRTSMVSVTSSAMTVSGFCSTITQRSWLIRLERRDSNCFAYVILCFSHVQYTDASGCETFFKFDAAPIEYDKKLKLLAYFRSYMIKHLLTTGAGLKTRGHEYARFPCLDAWFRTNSAIILLMSDGTLQLNFFQASCLRRCLLFAFPGSYQVDSLPVNGSSYLH